MGNLCGGAEERRDKDDEHLAFMACILKVKSMKQGWENSVIRVFKSCKGVWFRMDEKGMVEMNGICNPEIVMKKIGKSSNIKLEWYQFGQCSNNLVMQQPKSEKPKDEGKDKDKDNKLDPLHFPHAYGYANANPNVNYPYPFIKH